MNETEKKEEYYKFVPEKINDSSPAERTKIFRNTMNLLIYWSDKFEACNEERDRLQVEKADAEKELSRYKTALSFMISCARSGETNFDSALQLILNQKEGHNGN